MVSEWNRSVQRIIDCVEENLTEPLTLEILAKLQGYSPYYCTRQFQKYAKITLRDYIRLRKVSSAALELRDTKQRIIDIAVKYGFSSQEAFTRSFKTAYGITPNVYRKMPIMLPLVLKRNVFDPYYFKIGGTVMIEDLTKNVTVSIQVIPTHKFIGIRSMDADKYWDFWESEEEKHGEEYCDIVCGQLASIKSFNGQVGGWHYKDGKRGFLYGIEVPADYSGDVPAGMECTLIPESTYVIFHHPPYDYETMENAVSRALGKVLDNWDFTQHGYKRNYELLTYMRHDEDKYGQAYVIPIIKID